MEEKITRLPEWKACLDDMLAEGIDYGKVYSAEYFEEKLHEKRDSINFSLRIHKIRKALEHKGYYLSGRGQNGNQFIILSSASNSDVMVSYQRQAASALKRGVILGTNTRLDTLTDQERRRHESVLERIAIKAALMNRSQTIAKEVQKRKPKLLE